MLSLAYRVLIALALLVGPAAAQIFNLPELGLQNSGSCRQLAIRDRSNNAMVPLACLDTVKHGWVLSGDMSGMSLGLGGPTLVSVLTGKAASGSNVDITSLGGLTGPVQINNNSAAAGIIYGYTANVYGTGGSTDYVVGAQINGHSNNATGLRSVFGAALEAWTGDANTSPAMGATLIGIEPAVISQRHDQNSALVGVDIPFKNRPDGAAAPKQGLGANQYNKNGRAIQISAQPRSTAGEYSGWPVGILFTAGSLDQSVDGLAVGIDMSQLDSTRMLAAIRMPASGGLSWDLDQRTLRVLNGSLVFNALGTRALVVDSSGNIGVPLGITFSTPSGPVFTAASGGLLSYALLRSAEPTTTDIPSGQCADWINSATSTFKHWCNYQGTLRSVTLQ